MHPIEPTGARQAESKVPNADLSRRPVASPESGECQGRLKNNRFDQARAWWASLSSLRRTGFLLGSAIYFGSYEYVHDFHVKHPLVGLCGVITMIVTGGVRAEFSPNQNPAFKVGHRITTWFSQLF